MKHAFNKKALYGALLAAAGIGLAPASAQATSYYYSYFELTNINVLGQYKKDMNSNGVYDAGDILVWARPGSNEINPRAATFVANTAASNTAGGSMSKTDSSIFSSHVPPLGAFPVDAAESYTGTPPNLTPNIFTDKGNTGVSYSRADSYMNTLGTNFNPFSVLQSAGEQSQLVAEGRSTSTTSFASQATNTFTGYIDMTDLDFDDPAGTYDGTNLGWTGYLKLEYDYLYDIELNTETGDPGATVSRNVLFKVYQDTDGGGDGVTPPPTAPLVAEMKAGLGDMNCDVDGDGTYGEDCDDELSFSLSRSLGADYTETSAANAAFSQVFNLTGTRGIAGGHYFFELTFSQNVAGSAEAKAVPEPGIIALLGLGLLGLGMTRRYQRG